MILQCDDMYGGGVKNSEVFNLAQGQETEDRASYFKDKRHMVYD